jgi:hypothetical protein
MKKINIFLEPSLQKSDLQVAKPEALLSGLTDC